MAAIAWTLCLWFLTQHVTVPIAPFVVPLVVFFLFRLLLVPLLHARRPHWRRASAMRA